MRPVRPCPPNDRSAQGDRAVAAALLVAVVIALAASAGERPEAASAPPSVCTPAVA
jgi:hypothetical protein